VTLAFAAVPSNGEGAANAATLKEVLMHTCDRCGQHFQGDALQYKDRSFCSQDCLTSFKRDEAGASR